MPNSGEAETPVFTTKTAESPGDLADCLKIRTEVFVHEQGFPEETEIDEHDGTDAVKSFMVVDQTAGGKPVGVVRLVILPEKLKLTRLAVRKEYRKYGLGRRLVQALETYVRSHAAGPGETDLKRLVKIVDGKAVVQIKIHSQMPVVPFYARLGYREVGDIFDEEGEPHQAMVRDIDATSV